ncbi:Oxygen-independent coproporphyrinogen-III oxidase [Jannaschia rubra]|uniref:Coproporphyrinogen-III oxidase n=2 Tax=Jannaschia rubra TaxID=282197 RepID=A0A0M6XNY2_9RHOB|nr:Oxygen-independent coproporphyrinogen-III oxidase [Jannaschia rubra]SFG77993.1 oxygen-independent coproporphyrinogen-3 oxidase [Jannaschia rubra]
MGQDGAMENLTQLRALGLFDARAPRYTSYPPATAFTRDAEAGFQAQALAALDPAVPVSVYVHIPFCERLCWFCACRTQGTTSLSPVVAYLDTLEAELALMAQVLPQGLRMARLHWGGGTPTILAPEMIRRLAGSIMETIAPTDDLDFSVEIDPTMVDADKIAALAETGMTRASIGIQDFAPEVQAAIGREQSLETTRTCVDQLRQAGVGSLNADLVYGLPHQTEERIAASLDHVLDLAPDRIALFGYAHVPHMSPRQKLIDETALADGEGRHALARLAADRIVASGMEVIGIDHFARPDDGLAVAARTGRLRRNFQGYTDDVCAALIGVGASSVSKLPQGYVQNAAATPAYAQRIKAGELAGARGHRHGGEDLMRARAIEMLMCEFALDLEELERDFGSDVSALDAVHAQVLERFGSVVVREGRRIVILPEGHAVTRMIAQAYDAYGHVEAKYSKAS